MKVKSTINDKAFLIIVIPLSILFVTLLIMSLWWRMAYDLPVMLYLGFLMDSYNMVPYKDFLDVNMPGGFLLYMYLGKVFTFTDFGMRIADLFFLSVISYCTYRYTREFGLKVSILSVLFFGIIYLKESPFFTLQRDFFILVCLSLVMVIYFSEKHLRNTRFILIGILFGISFSIKPHSIIGFAGLAVFTYLDRKKIQKESSGMLKSLFLLTAGFLLPVAAVLIYLIQNDALNPMLNFYSNYLPLYSRLNGEHAEINSLTIKLRYISTQLFKFGDMPLLVLSSLTGMYFLFFNYPISIIQKRKIIIFVVFSICYFFYPAFSGQFFAHHWIIFIYFGIILSSLCIMDFNKSRSKLERLIPLTVLIFVLIAYVRPHKGFSSQISTGKTDPVYYDRVDQISEYLKENYAEGDKVLLMDWSYGSMDAALKTKVTPITPYIYDYYFYHHTSNDFIKGMRSDFISKLQNDYPEFIVRINYPGIERIFKDDFKELNEIILNNYSLEKEGHKYKIYRLN